VLRVRRFGKVAKEDSEVIELLMRADLQTLTDETLNLTNGLVNDREVSRDVIDFHISDSIAYRSKKGSRL
jgi:hypothetical protein